MKRLWISLVITLIPSVWANAAQKTNVASAEYYEFESWSGEYPTGYELYTDVRVPTVVSPANAKPGPDCSLKAKSVIHPWARKTQSQFMTQSPTTQLVAKRDFDLGDVKVKKGAKLTPLTYLSEGICRFSVNGQLAEDSCVFEDADDRASIESVSPFVVRELFKTACSNGKEAWIEASQLKTLTEEKESPSVGYAEILDFGSVKEP